jgi:hypothetical protein
MIKIKSYERWQHDITTSNGDENVRMHVISNMLFNTVINRAFLASLCLLSENREGYHSPKII